MFVRKLALAALLILAACDRLPQLGAPSAQDQPKPQLDAPAPEAGASRTFDAANDAARAATGQLSVALASRLPDAAHASDPPQDTITFHGANGLEIDGDLQSAMAPTTGVGGQPLTAVMALPATATQVSVYRVTAETKPTNGAGLCGATATGFLVVWEPHAQGEPVLKALGVSGAAPGASASHACSLLEYRRS